MFGKIYNYIYKKESIIKENAEIYFISLTIVFLYGFALKGGMYLIPSLIVLFIAINSLINNMFIHKKQIISLEEIRDFEYSIIISQSSDEDLLTSINYYLNNYRSNTNLYLEIRKLHNKLSNNESLDKEIHTLNVSQELSNFLRALSHTLNSGMDIKKVALLEYNALIKRIEAEKEIWASFSDKRLEIIIMIVMPPFIIYVARIGVASSISSKNLYDVLISTLTILCVCISCKIIENIIGDSYAA